MVSNVSTPVNFPLSVRSKVVASASRMTVRPFLQVFGAFPHAPWPYSLIGLVADLFMSPPCGTKLTKTKVAGLNSEVLTTKKDFNTEILYLHGGGFLTCAPSTHRRITGYLSKLTSSRVTVPDYSTLKKKNLKGILVECVEVYKSLLESGKPVVIAGDSAGGFLVFAVMAEIRKLGLADPAALVAFSPMSSLDPSDKIAQFSGNVDAMFPESAIWAVLRLARVSGTPRSEMHVPWEYLKTPPPTLIISSADEMFRSDTLHIASELGSSVEYKLFPGMVHAFPVLADAVPESLDQVLRTARFIKKHVSSKTVPVDLVA